MHHVIAAKTDEKEKKKKQDLKASAREVAQARPSSDIGRWDGGALRDRK